jgi:hypothetical protein
MGLAAQTLIMYLVAGAAVACAISISELSDSSWHWFRVATALPFWPIYVPILLAKKPDIQPKADAAAALQADEMVTAIKEVDHELEMALGSLDGWAEDVLAREKTRIHELRSVWNGQAERIRQIDRLLASPEFADAADALPGANPLRIPGETSSSIACRLQSSRAARRQNIERLRSVRRRAYEDLMGTLAWVRELVSMIHLAKFTGAPASRADELVAQIAAAVEGLAEVTWRDETSARAADSI